MDDAVVGGFAGGDRLGKSLASGRVFALKLIGEAELPSGSGTDSKVIRMEMIERDMGLGDDTLYVLLGDGQQSAKGGDVADEIAAHLV